MGKFSRARTSESCDWFRGHTLFIRVTLTIYHSAGMSERAEATVLWTALLKHTKFVVSNQVTLVIH